MKRLTLKVCLILSRTFLALMLASIAIASAYGDDAVSALQTSLKNKGYFYGTPNGTLDEETHSAIRRYQIHEGLPVTGDLDGPTSKALGMTAPPIKKSSAAVVNAPAARGESAGPLQKSDREFLRQLDEQRPTDRITIRPTPEPNSPPTTSPLPTPEHPQPSAVPVARPSNLGNEIAAFVNKYLVVGASADVAGEVSLYADAVDYFNNGRVNRGFIQRDTANYRRRWPRRDYLLEGKPAVIKSSPDGSSVTVRFRLRYQVQAGLQTATGRTESTMELLRNPGGSFEIISIKETQVAR